jgi:hypothetical protein
MSKAHATFSPAQANVPLDDVDVTVTAASVRITVTIAAFDQTAATAVTTNLLPVTATAEAATSLLASLPLTVSAHCSHSACTRYCIRAPFPLWRVHCTAGLREQRRCGSTGAAAAAAIAAAAHAAASSHSTCLIIPCLVSLSVSHCVSHAASPAFKRRCGHEWRRRRDA